MQQNKIQTVPKQRVITVNKEPTDKQNIYTMNNISAIDEAAFYLQSKAGFKLYMYLAKNQNNRQFALSSAAFTAWSGTGLTAYNTAFKELVSKGYLVQKEGTETIYTFFDKSRHNLKENDKLIIEYANAAAAGEPNAAAAEEPKAKEFEF